MKTKDITEDLGILSNDRELEIPEGSSMKYSLN